MDIPNKWIKQVNQIKNESNNDYKILNSTNNFTMYVIPQSFK